MHISHLMLVTLLAAIAPVLQGGKVLVFPVEGSHWINMQYILEGLHLRGHSITVIRPQDSWYVKETSPYYSTIQLNSGGGVKQEEAKVYVNKLLHIVREGSRWARIKLDMEMMSKTKDMFEKLCKLVTYMFEDKELMKTLRDAKYDLVLTDPAFSPGTLLAHYLKLPLVYNVRWTVRGEAHFAIAPSPLSYVPIPMLQLSDRMSFLQRVQNMLVYLISQVQFKMLERPFRELCERYFGPDVNYFELFQAADIWLMRVDFIFEFPRPTMPNVIYMSGFQCKPAKPLPQDLEDFVQSSGEHGVIVMSMGTLFEQLPHDMADDIAAAFAELPQKVIWRHTGDRPSALGNNTLLVKWMPQNDLLGHSKTRMFISHGGTNGIQEAIYHGVPLVGLPLIFDQPDNLFKMQIKGVAKIVDIATMDKNIFLQALQEVLNDPSYQTKMKMLSALQRDRPMNSLDTALFWIEYVMRHKGAAHLRTESYKMPWYTYHSADVMLFLLASILLIVLISIVVIRYLCCSICLKRKRTKQE